MPDSWVGKYSSIFLVPLCLERTELNANMKWQFSSYLGVGERLLRLISARPLGAFKEIHVSVHSWRKKTFLNVVSLRGVSFLPNMGRSDSDSSDQMGSLAQPDPSPQSCVPLSLCYRDKGCSCLFIFSSNQSQSCRGGAQSPGCSRWGAVRTKNDYYSNTALHETRSKWMAQSAPRRKRQQLFCRDHFESALMNDRKTDSQLKSLWIYRDIG